jgi:hypothetical protein
MSKHACFNYETTSGVANYEFISNNEYEKYNTLRIFSIQTTIFQK